MSRPEASRRGPDAPSWLCEGFTAGVERHGDLGLAFECYREHVLFAAGRRAAAGSGRSTAGAITKVARTLALDDLYLACACEQGIEAAWDALQKSFGYRLTALLRKRNVPTQTATQLVAELPGMLVVEPGAAAKGGRSRLSSFDGSGSLFGWLAVIVMRAWHHLRVGGPQSLSSDLPTAVVGPEAASVDSELGERFAEAVRLAWGRLSPRHRTVLALRYSHGMPQVEIMRVLGVSAPRISRLLDRAVCELRTCVELVVGRSGGDLLRHWSVMREALGVELQRLHGKAL